MLSILQPEVSALESQVAALQAQIAAHTERISLLNETELLAGGSLEALRCAIEKVSSLAPDAIASLKSAVLDLFRGDSSDDNQPINPAPQRSDDGGVSSAISPQPETLTGQSSEWASPWASPLASSLASTLACQLEDAPSAALTGQAVDLACVVSDAPKEPDYIELVPLNHLVAYQRKTSTGEIICCYVGGNNKNRLKDWGSWLCTQHSVGSGFEVRKALRLTAYNHELKIWGMSLKQIERLAETDTRKTPPSRYHVASMPVAERLLAPEIESAPEEVEQVAEVIDHDVEECLALVAKLEQVPSPDPQGFQVGDKVQVISDRHGVELVGQTGIVTAGTAAGAAVNVGGTLRWFCSDEAVLVEASPQPRNAADDLFPTTPAPTYNANPIGRGGAAANWKARQASGIGVNLKDCGTGGITSLEEWQRIEAEQKAQKALAATASTTDALA